MPSDGLPGDGFDSYGQQHGHACNFQSSVVLTLSLEEERVT